MEEPLYQHYNTDDIFNRSVIAGLLNLLNHRLTYKQVWADNVVEEVTVPFAYNLSNNKQNQDFIQDNYTFFGRECFSDNFIDGKFDMLPRFAVSYTGSQINSSEITNRFVKGKYMKDEGGMLVSYTAFMYSIPLTMNFEVEGWIDNIDTAFKLEQAIRDVFYKNQTFNVLYRGMKIGCCVGFPESISGVEKTVSYGFEQDAQLKMSFNLAVECYQPCFDESMVMKTTNTIQHVGFGTDLYNDGEDPTDKKITLKLGYIDTDKKYATGNKMIIKWNMSSNVTAQTTVFLYYMTDDGEKHYIGMPLMNKQYYEWTIPSTLSKYVQPEIVFIEDNISIIRQPKIIVTPESDGLVTTGCFVVSDPGKFSQSGYVQVSCEAINSSGTIKIHDCYVAEIGEDLGVTQIFYIKDSPYKEFEVVNPKRFKYAKGEFLNKISIGVSYPMNEEIGDVIDNVLII